MTGNQLQYRAILARAQPAGKKHFFSSVSTCATSSLVCLIRHQDTGANPAEGHQSCWVLGRVTSEERLGDQGAAPCGEEQVQGIISLTGEDGEGAASSPGRCTRAA